MMEDKTRFITPLLMLFAGAIASIIMAVRGYELTRMLWILLIVLIIFYFLGDTARYIYSTIKPRIIPDADFSEMEKMVRENLEQTGNIEEITDDKEAVEEGTLTDEENVVTDTDSAGMESLDEGE
jgi:hypothetical protein